MERMRPATVAPLPATVVRTSDEGVVALPSVSPLPPRTIAALSVAAGLQPPPPPVVVQQPSSPWREPVRPHWNS
eukprot:7380818-Prymnesium_polylepis.1